MNLLDIYKELNTEEKCLRLPRAYALAGWSQVSVL